MKIFKAALFGAMAVSLVACQQGAGPKQNIGTIGGAVAGGLAGSQFGGGSGKLWAAGAGVLIGSLVGSSIGQSLDRADQQYMSQSTQRALESGQSGQAVEWRNPDSGNYGTVVPQRAYQQNNTQCREYSQNIVVGGKSERGYGTACRQPDGSWQIVNG
ncbi:MAG: RT0821/Lpp0805 family surface protein [Parvibaculum sp.]|nr:RT0821/Lpp0805 family surface protein [Parvibaculum sp.]|tara:strand:- start:2580 stop:3053 length:474 start_codon:yes stop_codon:yes gene_type:complete